MFKSTYIFIILLCFGFCNAQTAKTINKIKKDYQNCLDKGDNMKKCSYGYLHKSDSLLNVVYNKVKLKLNSTQKAKLKKEQLAWLKKRDAYFDKVIKSTLNGEEGLIGDDLRMVIADKEADFVFDRVEELIRRL